MEAYYTDIIYYKWKNNFKLKMFSTKQGELNLIFFTVAQINST